MKLDRDLQITILRVLRETYPNTATLHPRPEIIPDHADLEGNIAYLKERGFIRFSSFGVMTKQTKPTVNARITADGLDFLESIENE